MEGVAEGVEPSGRSRNHILPAAVSGGSVWQRVWGIHTLPAVLTNTLSPTISPGDGASLSLTNTRTHASTHKRTNTLGCDSFVE